MPSSERVIIVGGPRRGKSTLAQQLVLGWPQCPHRCGDPLSKVKDPLPGVEYLPEGIPISGDDGAAQWVADNWFGERGPWVCEGWAMARALRRWISDPLLLDGHRVSKRTGAPADRVIVLTGPAWVEASKGQESMHKAVMTVWHTIASQVAALTEVEYR